MPDEKEKQLHLIDDLRLAFQRSASEKAELVNALHEIKTIANGVREFNYPCEKIYNIARKGLGEES